MSSCIKSARKVLGDSGERQIHIKTVPRRGVRFIADVIQDQAQLRVQNRTSTERRPKYSEPSLIVLPFKTIGGSPAINGFAECLVANLDTVLTRIPLLHISSQGSGYANPDVTPTARQINDSKEDMDRSVIAIITNLEPQFNRAIYDSVRTGEEEPSARELYLKANGILAMKGWHLDTCSEAANLLRRSSEQDAKFALAPAYLSLILALGHRVGLPGERAQTKQEAIQAAEQALKLDNMDSTVLGFVGCAMADLGLISRSLPILKNAVALNPNNARAWATLGSAHGQVRERGLGRLHKIPIKPPRQHKRITLVITTIHIAGPKSEGFETAQTQPVTRRDS